jgi:hypothetical protein
MLTIIWFYTKYNKVAVGADFFIYFCRNYITEMLQW